jgi:hypothetical protein
MQRFLCHVEIDLPVYLFDAAAFAYSRATTLASHSREHHLTSVIGGSGCRAPGGLAHEGGDRHSAAVVASSPRPFPVLNRYGFRLMLGFVIHANGDFRNPKPVLHPVPLVIRVTEPKSLIAQRTFHGLFVRESVAYYGASINQLQQGDTHL